MKHRLLLLMVVLQDHMQENYLLVVLGLQIMQLIRQVTIIIQVETALISVLCLQDIAKTIVPLLEAENVIGHQQKLLSQVTMNLLGIELFLKITRVFKDIEL